MRKTSLFWILLLLWAGAIAASAWALFGMEPTGDGFTRGLNRLTAFFGWQLLAAAIALGVWLVGRRLDGTALRWLARVPGLVALLLVLGITALILWARLSKPAPVAAPPPGQVTAPAATAEPVPAPKQ